MNDDSQQIDAGAVPAASPRRRGGPWLFLFVLLLGAVGAGYWWWTREVVATTVSAPAPVVVAPDVDSLRARLEDAAQVNRALRQQVLGLTQRLGVIEENIGNLGESRAPGIDAQRLVEADFLLHMAEQRLALFGDVAGALAALRLADGQLKVSGDVRAATVRQTLQLEIDILAGVASADLPPLLARLQALSDAANGWPLASTVRLAPAGGEAWHQRALAALDRYFRVRRLDDAQASDLWVRDRIALDLSAARWLLLRGEGASAKALLTNVRETMGARLETRDAGVTQALAQLDEILAAPLAPELPALGEARRELARLQRADSPVANVPTTIDSPAPSVQPNALAPEAPSADGPPVEDTAPPSEVPEAGAPVDAATPSDERV